MVSKRIIVFIPVIAVIFLIIVAIVIGLIFSNIGNDYNITTKYVITVTKRTTARPSVSYHIIVAKGLTLVQPDVLNILRRWETSSDAEKQLVEAYREVVRERIESFLRKKVLRLDSSVVKILKTLSTTTNNLTVTDVKLSAENDMDVIDIDYTILTQSQSIDEASQLVNTTSDYLFNSTAYIDLVIDNSTTVAWSEPSIQVDFVTTTTSSTLVSSTTTIFFTNTTSIPANLSCISNIQCNETMVCLNGTCDCPYCFFLLENRCVHSKFCEAAFLPINPVLNPLNFSTNLRNFDIFNDSYYVSDRDFNRILIFNRTGYLERQMNATRPMYVLKAGPNFYYTSDTSGILKTDLNFNILANYTPVVNFNGYRSIYFDDINERLLITNSYNQNYESFDLNLVPLPTPGSFNSTDGLMHGISMYQDFIYISTTTGRIIKVINNTKIDSFQTLCPNTIAQIVIDQVGVMTVPCNQNRTVFFYHVNGTYLNKRINTDSPALYADFGPDGKFAILSQNKFSLVN